MGLRPKPHVDRSQPPRNKQKVCRGSQPPRFKPRLFSGRPSRSCAVKLSLPRLLPPPRETPRRPTNKPTEAAAQKAPVRRGAKPPRFNDGRLPSPVATAAPTAPPYPTRPRVVASPSGRYPPAKQPEGPLGGVRGVPTAPPKWGVCPEAKPSREIRPRRRRRVARGRVSPSPSGEPEGRATGGARAAKRSQEVERSL